MNPPKPIHPHLRELLALSLVPQLGAQRIRLLLQHAEQPQDIFRMKNKDLVHIDGIGPAIAGEILKFNGWAKVDQLLERTAGTEATIITCLDDNYPLLLGEIYDPPVVLWVKGDSALLSSEGIAVVGTRQASGYGIKMAEYFTSGLVEHGLTIVSGLAYGVDAAAHRTALNEKGKTVAVLGSGIDVIYPNKHIPMSHEIIEQGGAVISEFPPGTAPDAGNFPVRNRIVSGLTYGTLVIESGIRGGSMITARSALDQNREVFVVPHSLDSSSGIGCNAIIKRGWGKLVQDVKDILNEVPILTEKTEARESRSFRWEEMELDEISEKICRTLEVSALHIDDLSEQIDMPPNELLAKLLELEMMNCIRQTAGKNFELKK